MGHNFLVTSNPDLLSNKFGPTRDASSDVSTSDEVMPWMPANLPDPSSTEEEDARPAAVNNPEDADLGAAIAASLQDETNVATAMQDNQSAQSIRAPAEHCLNYCGYTFSGKEKYCAECGRKREITAQQADARTVAVDNPEDEALAAATATALQGEIDVASAMHGLRFGDIVEEQMPSQFRAEQNLSAHARGLVTAVHDNGTISVAWQDSSDAHDTRVNADWVRKVEELRIYDIVEEQMSSQIRAQRNLPAHTRGLVTEVHDNGTVAIVWEHSYDADYVNADCVRKVEEQQHTETDVVEEIGVCGRQAQEVQDEPIPEERRMAPDGQLYTQHKFIDFFRGTNEWNQALGITSIQQQEADISSAAAGNPEDEALAAAIAASFQDEVDAATAMQENQSAQSILVAAADYVDCGEEAYSAKCGGNAEITAQEKQRSTDLTGSDKRTAAASSSASDTASASGAAPAEQAKQPSSDALDVDQRTTAACSRASGAACSSGAASSGQAKSKTTRSGWLKKLALCGCA